MKTLRITITILTLVTLLVPALAVEAQGPDEPTRLIPPRDHSTGTGVMLLHSTPPPPPPDYTAALALGADRLLALQADITEDNAGNGDPDADPEDGGWDWAVDPTATAHSASPSPENTYGVTAMGLVGAYAATGAPRYWTALQDAAAGIAARPGVDSCGDFRFLVTLSLITGNPAYAALAKERYDAKKASYGGAAEWAEEIRDVRANVHHLPNGIIPWDIGGCAMDAAALNKYFSGMDYDADADAMAEVIYADLYENNPGYFDETDRTEWWWTLGIAGALSAFRAANVHATEQAALAQALMGYQNDGTTKTPAGAWDWNDDYGGGDYQTTAYVVMALMAHGTKEASIAALAGINWLVSAQRPNGRWYWDEVDEYTEEEGEVLTAIALAAAPSRARTVNYGNVPLSGGFQSGNFQDKWDLTACPLTLMATVDLTGLVDDADAHAWSELGVRQVGGGNFNPTWQAEGAGVWLATDYDWTPDTFNPDLPNTPTLDLDDKLILQKGGGWGEGSYDLPLTPPNPWANHGIWYDRDGVDPSQALMWGSVDGGTYNTGGKYHVVIGLRADSATSGSAYMAINGILQGFYVPNWHAGPPDLYPAGMTFTGDMTRMQVFYGLYGYGAVHTVSLEDVVVLGCPYEEPTAIELASFTAEANGGAVTLAWETAAEIDNAGFNLYRAASADGPWTQVNGALIAAQGGPASGAAYNFVDAGLATGTYYYQLEDVDYNGVATLHGPVQVTLAPVFRRPLYRPTLPR